MTRYTKQKLGDICRIEKGRTGIASAVPGEYPLVVTAEERKTCGEYQFDCEAVCIPLVSSSGHGKKSLKNVHYQSGKFALGSILCAVIPNNPQKVNARYLHQYLQFYKDTVLVPLMKGAANVSLSIRDIANVEIPLPDFKTQVALTKIFVQTQEKQKELNAEFEKQTEYAKQLRQSILQEAIEGKLTTEWRKNHPAEKGNPDFDAQALFEQIQKEKEGNAFPCGRTSLRPTPSAGSNAARNARSKNLPEITDPDQPFEIPDGWKYILPENIGIFASGKTPDKEDLIQDGIPYFKISDMNTCGNELYLLHTDTFISSDTKIKCFPKNSIVFPKNGGAVFTNKKRILKSESLVDLNTGVFIPSNWMNPKFAFWLFYTIDFNNYWKGTTLPTVDMNLVRKIIWKLPPLAEQKEIVAKVESLLAKVTGLENQIQERKKLSVQLMQTVLKNAFLPQK